MEKSKGEIYVRLNLLVKKKDFSRLAYFYQNGVFSLEKPTSMAENLSSLTLPTEVLTNHKM